MVSAVSVRRRFSATETSQAKSHFWSAAGKAGVQEGLQKMNVGAMQLGNLSGEATGTNRNGRGEARMSNDLMRQGLTSRNGSSGVLGRLGTNLGRRQAFVNPAPRLCCWMTSQPARRLRTATAEVRIAGQESPEILRASSLT